MQAPRAVLEQQFVSLIQQATQSNKPIRLKMSRKVPVYDDFNDKWIERGNSVVFANNAYIKVKGEDL